MLEQEPENPAIIEDHQKLQSFFDTSVFYVKALNPDGRLVFANKSELAYSGFSKEEYVDRHFADFAVDRAKAAELVETLKTGNELHDQELQFRKKSGEKRHLLVSSMTRTDRDGVKYHYIFCRDITSFKRTQELLDYLNQAGEELASARDTETALNKVSNLIVPRFANWFTIDTLKGNAIVRLKVKHAEAAQV